MTTLAQIAFFVGRASPRANQMPDAKSQKPPPELGRTGDLPFLRNLLYFKHMNQNRPTQVPELGRTAVRPNTC